MDGYTLTRRWYDWCFRYSGHHTPAHAALYGWFVEACNRVDWAETFEMAPQYAMTAIGVRSYNTYKDTLSDLQTWGFVRIRQKGANQYVPWLLALSDFDEPLNNPLDKPNGDALSNFDIPLNKARNKAPENAVSKFDEPCNNPLDEACNKACNNPLDAITINNKPTNLKPQTLNHDAENDAVAIEIFVDPEEKKGQALTPSSARPPSPKPIPIPAGKVYGDGVLQADVVTYYTQFPDQFPLHIYLPFLRYWTSKNQKGDPVQIGVEKWRTQNQWDIEIRLNSWNERDIKKALENQPQHGNQPATNPNGYTGSAHANRYGSADYETAFNLVDALAKAGGLNG
ncbi:hypothetical protein GCM10028818_40720 [Spirosoma horti]